MVREIIHNEDDINTTVALAITWGLPSICQVEGCGNATSAIICLDKEESPTTLPYKLCICEEHYQKGIREGRLVENFDL